MKNLKCFVLGFIFILLAILSISSDTFAIATKYVIKSGTEEALNIFLEAEKEFVKGQKFQHKNDFENASVCYAKSLELWPVDETYFKLTFCLYSAKFYDVAVKMIFAGLKSNEQKRDLKKFFCFFVLLADIYYEIGDFNKALSIYKHLAELPMDEESSNFIERRIGETLFKVVFNP